ncbi:MAG: flagellar hook protein FlgE, partial [Deltaproteobacteria bacterium]|nr:flagellar hook protein FlgE [Deltaproteobacteria bacterium]
EQSNVDMAAQLVNMITTQRAYSANSKTITTADEMLQETLNLKR